MRPANRRMLIGFAAGLPLALHALLDVIHADLWLRAGAFAVMVPVLFLPLLDFLYFGHWSITRDEWDRWAQPPRNDGGQSKSVGGPKNTT